MNDAILTPDDTLEALTQTEAIRDREREEMRPWLKEALEEIVADGCSNFPHLSGAEIKEEIIEWTRRK